MASDASDASDASWQPSAQEGVLEKSEVGMILGVI
jgi:hypothetical protein